MRAGGARSAIGAVFKLLLVGRRSVRVPASRPSRPRPRHQRQRGDSRRRSSHTSLRSRTRRNWLPILAMIVLVRRSGHRKKFTEPVALSSTQPTDLPLPRRAFRLSFDLLALRARCVEEPTGKARPGQAPTNRIGAVCALLRVEKLCVEQVPRILGIAERVWICARSCGPRATSSDPHAQPSHPSKRHRGA